MSEEATTPDLVRLARQGYEAMNRGDLDEVMSGFAADAVYDMSGAGFETFEGTAAIRSFIDDWHRSWEDYRYDVEELVDFGHGVVLGVVYESGRLVGSEGRVEQRVAHLAAWTNGKIVRQTHYTDIDEARAAAERLAEERGQAMSQENVDLVRSIYAAWERGEFDSADWAHPEIEYVSADGPDPGTWTGLAEMAEQFRAWLRLWEGFRLTADRYRQVGAEQVVVHDHLSGHGKTSGVDLGQMQTAGAWVFDIRDGKVIRMIRYIERDRALADLGLAE